MLLFKFYVFTRAYIFQPQLTKGNAQLLCNLNLPVFSSLEENFSVEKTFFALKGFPWFEILSNVHNFTNGSFNCLHFHLLTDNMLVSASWLSTKLKQERKGWCTGMTCQVTT